MVPWARVRAYRGHPAAGVSKELDHSTTKAAEARIAQESPDLLPKLWGGAL